MKSPPRNCQKKEATAVYSLSTRRSAKFENTPELKNSNVPNAPSSRKWKKKDDDNLLCLIQERDGFDPSRDDAGIENWRIISVLFGNGRSTKQCRERWSQCLRPGIKKGEWTHQEEDLIVELYEHFGPRWSSMAKLFDGRTDNDIKNKWHSMVRAQVRVETLVASKTIPEECEYEEEPSGATKDQVLLLFDQKHERPYKLRPLKKRPPRYCA